MPDLAIVPAIFGQFSLSVPWLIQQFIGRKLVTRNAIADMERTTDAFYSLLTNKSESGSEFNSIQLFRLVFSAS